MPYDIIFGTGTGRKIDEAEENSALSLLSHNGLTFEKSLQAKTLILSIGNKSLRKGLNISKQETM